MLESRDKIRCDPPDNYTYHDRVFANRMHHLIQLTDRHYQAAMYRDALKTGFYDLQVRYVYLLSVRPRHYWIFRFGKTHRFIPSICSYTKFLMITGHLKAVCVGS